MEDIVSSSSSSQSMADAFVAAPAPTLKIRSFSSSFMDKRIRLIRINATRLMQDDGVNKDSVGRMKSSRVQLTKKRYRRRQPELTTEEVPKHKSAPSSMDSALCIIPPEEVWDPIQRARHMAKDTTYQVWPPAIRLFHPFVLVADDDDDSDGDSCGSSTSQDEFSFTLAKLIEQHKIEPFEIKLRQWSIIPHMEKLEILFGTSERTVINGEDDADDRERREFVDRLIEKEERIAEKKNRRRKNAICIETYYSIPEDEEPSPKERLERQKAGKEEFNGPCLVCLEPDRKSAAKLQKLRNLILKEAPHLFEPYCLYSPTSSVSTSLPKSLLMQTSKTNDYRPLLPIAACSTVTAAVSIARSLRSSWKPLKFDVTELHLISRGVHQHDADRARPHGQENDEFEDNPEYQLRRALLTTKSSGGTTTVMGSTDPSSITTGASATDVSIRSNQFGCDAQVFFMGQEIVEEDDPVMTEVNQLMANYLCEHGFAGGADPENIIDGCVMEEDSDDELLFNNNESESSSETNDSLYENIRKELLEWLVEDNWLEDEEEEKDSSSSLHGYDDGATFVHGRIHFFEGEDRMYTGMPAVSMLEYAPSKEKRETKQGLDRLETSRNQSFTEDCINGENKEKKTTNKKSSKT